MKQKIESQLECIVGLPLESTGRASNLIWFSFGKSQIVIKNGKEKNVSEYALHVQCSWRITSATVNKILVASRDIFIPSTNWNGNDDDFNWDIQGMNRCDEKLASVINKCHPPMIVKEVHADNLGGVIIRFENNYTLEVFPDESTDNEYWRFFKPGDISTHFIVTGNGIEK